MAQVRQHVNARLTAAPGSTAAHGRCAAHNAEGWPLPRADRQARIPRLQERAPQEPPLPREAP